MLKQFLKATYLLVQKHLWKLFLVFLIIGAFYPPAAVIAAICMIAPLIFAISGHGRFWCGNICPRGNFYDKVVSRFSSKRKPIILLNSKWLRVAVIAFMFTMFGSGIIAATSWFDAGMVFYRIIAITSIVGIGASFFFNHRAWCSVCPIGTISSSVTRKSRKGKKMLIDSKCVSCGLCTRSCPVGIEVRNYIGTNIEHSDCLVCGKCATACKKKLISRA